MSKNFQALKFLGMFFDYIKKIITKKFFVSTQILIIQDQIKKYVKSSD